MMMMVMISQILLDRFHIHNIVIARPMMMMMMMMMMMIMMMIGILLQNVMMMVIKDEQEVTKTLDHSDTGQAHMKT